MPQKKNNCFAVIPTFFPLHRRDKYEPEIKEYWIDINTTGTFMREDEEQLIDRTSAEGTATSFDLGLPADQGLKDSPDESDAESGYQAESGTEASVKGVKPPKPSEVEKEHLYEARPCLIPLSFHSILTSFNRQFLNMLMFLGVTRQLRTLAMWWQTC